MKRIGIVAHCIVFALAAQASPAATAQVKSQTPAGQPQPGPFSSGINQTPWFSGEQVRQNIGLDPQQLTGLNQAYQNAWANYRKGVSGIDASLPEAERQQKLLGLQQGFFKDFAEAPGKFINNSAQRLRL